VHKIRWSTPTTARYQYLYWEPAWLCLTIVSGCGSAEPAQVLRKLDKQYVSPAQIEQELIAGGEECHGAKIPGGTGPLTMLTDLAQF